MTVSPWNEPLSWVRRWFLTHRERWAGIVDGTWTDPISQDDFITYKLAGADVYSELDCHALVVAKQQRAPTTSGRRCFVARLTAKLPRIDWNTWPRHPGLSPENYSAFGEPPRLSGIGLETPPMLCAYEETDVYKRY